MAKTSTNRDGAAESATPSEEQQGNGKPLPTIPKKAVYLGPTIIDNGIYFRHGQIFNNGVPAAWLDKAAASPDFRLFLVPFARVGEVRRKLTQTGSIYARAAESLRMAGIGNRKGVTA